MTKSDTYQIIFNSSLYQSLIYLLRLRLVLDEILLVAEKL